MASFISLLWLVSSGTEELEQDYLLVLSLWSPLDKESLGVLDLVLTIWSM